MSRFRALWQASLNATKKGTIGLPSLSQASGDIIYVVPSWGCLC
jgi:hypothetical protein